MNSVLGIGIAVIAVLVASFHFLPKELEAQGHGPMPRKFGIKGLFAAGHVLLLLLIIFGVHLGVNFQVVRAIVTGDVNALEASAAEIERAETSELDAGSAGRADEPADSPDQGAGSGPAATGAPTDRPIPIPALPSLQSVITGTAIFFGLLGSGRWRRIEAAILRQLQHVSMVEEDVEALASNLKLGDFSSDAMSTPAPAALDRLQKRISPEAADKPDVSLAVRWAKLDALLSIWEKSDDWAKTLPAVETPILRAARSAHERKSNLAIKIERHVTQIERGEADPEILARISRQIRRDQEPDDPSELKVKGTGQDRLNGGSEGQKTLHELLEPVLEYFVEEYDDLLTIWTHATAKSVMLAGDGAETRLRALEKNGFRNIGKFSPIELNRALGMAVMVFLAVLIALYAVGKLLSALTEKAPNIEGGYIFVVAFNLTLATILGSMLGGIRALARRPETPWVPYIVAGLLVGLTHSIVSLTAINMGIEPSWGAGESGNARPLRYYLIIAIFPFAIVLGICLLGRRPSDRSELAQRLRDAAALAGCLVVAGILFIIMADMLKIPPPSEGLGVPERMAMTALFAGAIGAIIGGSVIYHVRHAALCNVIEIPTGQERRADGKPDLAAG